MASLYAACKRLTLDDPCAFQTRATERSYAFQKLCNSALNYSVFLETLYNKAILLYTMSPMINRTLNVFCDIIYY